MKKILYFEDEEDFRILIEFFLCDLGYNVNSYSNPTEFLKNNGHVEKNLEYNLLISDISMPNMTGTEFAKKYIVDKKLKIPILFLSGRENEIDIRNAGIENFYFLNKPTNIKTLQDKVKEILE